MAERRGNARSSVAVWRQRGEGALSGWPIFGDSHSSISTPSLRFQTSFTTPSAVQPPMMTAFGLLGRPTTTRECPVRSDGPLSGFLICAATRHERTDRSLRFMGSTRVAAARALQQSTAAQTTLTSIVSHSRFPTSTGMAGPLYSTLLYSTRPAP